MLHPDRPVHREVDELAPLLVELVAVTTLQQLRVARHHAQRLLQVVRRDVGELLQLLVAALELADQLPQRAILLLDAAEHLVEGVGQAPQLVVAQLRGPDRIVLPLGDPFRRVREQQDGPRNRPLELIREEIRHQHGDAVHGLKIGAKEQRPQAGVPRLGHRLEADEVRALEAVSVPGGRRRQVRHRQVRRIAGEQPAILVVEGGGDDVGLRPQRRQNLPRVAFVLKRERGRAVGRDDCAEGRDTLERGLPEGQHLVREKRGAREHHDHAAREAQDRHQFLTNPRPSKRRAARQLFTLGAQPELKKG